MTKLKSSSTRKLQRQAASPGPRGRAICLELEWPNVIHLWEKGSRTKYTTTFESCYMMAAKQHAAAQKGGNT